MKTIIDDINYGPLALLVGKWAGDKGMDIAPESDGTVEENPFYEELVFEAGGNVTNADRQELAIVSYHQKVFRKSNQEQFHDQLGYWLWDSEAQTIMHTVSIPRGVTLVAGGEFAVDSDDLDSALLKVASEDGGDWGIAQSPFMRDNARTTAFSMTLKVDAEKISYSQTTMLDIYGREFDHTDKSQLVRVEP